MNDEEVEYLEKLVFYYRLESRCAACSLPIHSRL